MPARVYILVVWDKHQDLEGKEFSLPRVRHFEDEHEAIEILKDALPLHHRASLFWTDDTGGWGRVPGWY